MREITYTVYKIYEHPDKHKCYEWMRENMHDLAEHEGEDFIASVNNLHEYIGGDLDWNVSLVPDRGEFIRFTDYDKEMLDELDASACPLTGFFWDVEVIEHLRANDMQGLMNKLHEAHDSHYTDEALYDSAQVNEWEFKENGVMV